MNWTKTYANGSTPTVAIIGAGVSGICAAIQLQRQLQLTTYTVFELEADVGGTWLNNTYPGAGLDAPACVYGYSFAPNFEWSKTYVPQQEVLDYFRSTAKVYNIYDKIRFSTRVTNMRWHEGRKKWILHWVDTLSNEEGDHQVDIVIQGAGLLRIPKVPEQFQAFEGAMWHSAKWNHSVDLTGKRVGVVGTSASGVQLIPAIADKVATLDVYGRSPAYILPQYNGENGPFWRFLCNYVPYFYLLYSAMHFFFSDGNILLYHKLSWSSFVHRAIAYFITWFHRFTQLPSNPTLRRKLTPKYQMAARRTVFSNTYHPTFKRDNVSLHVDEVVSVKGKTIETADGSIRELDVLVLATGFDWVAIFPPEYWFGRNGIDIPVSWGENVTTYYGTCTPNAPNFFMVWGPNSGIAHNSLTVIIETQVMFIIRSLSYMMENDIATMEVTQEAADEFLELMDRRMEKMMFTTKVFPKFMNSQGKCRGFFFGSCSEFWWRLRHIHPERFLFQSRKEVAEKPHAHLNGVSGADLAGIGEEDT
ncbi:hypothetical protein BG004_003850 [Podila humilis]|nr:hypothetical protein BG004_003850 [Podila humilis]